MGVLTTKKAVEHNQFGKLLIRYNPETGEFLTQKISQVGQFWEHELNDVQEKPILFFHHFKKRDISELKKELKNVFETKGESAINLSLKREQSQTDYKGYLSYLFADTNEQVYIDITLFKKVLEKEIKSIELDKPHEIGTKEIENYKTEFLEQPNCIEKSTKMAVIANWEYDHDNGLVHISNTLADFLEYDGDFSMKLDEELSNLIGSTAFKKIKKLIQHTYTNRSNWDTYLRIKTAKGTIKWIRSLGWFHPSNVKNNIQGCIQDVNYLKVAPIQLENKSRYLFVLSKINETLLKKESWSSILNTCIELLGSAVNSDRVYYYNYVYDDFLDGYTYNLLYEWVSDGVIPQINNVELKNIPEEYLEPASTFLKTGNIFIANTEEMENPRFRSLMLDRGIESMILAPVFSNNEFNGFIGIETHLSNLVLNAEALEFFTTVVQNISLVYDRFQITNKLQNTLEEKKNILESIQDGFFAIDEDFKIIYWNNKAESIFKKSKSEILNEYIFEVFENDEFSELNYYFEKAKKLETALSFKLNFKSLKSWLEFNVYTSKTDFYVYFRDITEKIINYEKLYASNERFKLISEASNDAIWEWNLENDDLTWGDGFQRNFGVDLGRGSSSLEVWTAHIHKDDLKTVLNTIKKAIKTTNKNKFYVRYRFLRSDGDYAYVIDRSSIIRNSEGKAVKMVGAITDFSKIIKYEDSLKDLNKSLNKRAEELITINKELEQFAYIASHDLQEPLRMVSSFLNRLDEKYNSVLDEKGKKYISFAVDGAERMRKIITDLLTYSRLINYDGHEEDVDLNLVVKEIFSENKNLIDNNNIKIRIDDLPVIKNFKTPIKQVFINLINNALKYSDKDNTLIEIRCKDNMSHWLFEIVDNGIGIESKYFVKIFVIFQRLHDQSIYEGSGLGLAIVKKVIEKLGGKIWVESEPGNGSVFSFTIRK